MRTFPRRTPFPRACHGQEENGRNALFERKTLYAGATEKGRANESEGGRTACGIVVTFEFVRVTEWNGSTVDERRVGTGGSRRNSQSRVDFESERGERTARGDGERRRGGQTYTRAFSAEPRYAYACTQRATSRTQRWATASCVRA